jgi:hypothetical protein
MVAAAASAAVAGAMAISSAMIAVAIVAATSPCISGSTTCAIMVWTLSIPAVTSLLLRSTWSR